jgi:phospholipase C
MKHGKSIACLVFAIAASLAMAQSSPQAPGPKIHVPGSPFPPQIRNVVIVVQENRTPDNLFHFLTPACPLPAFSDALDACIPKPVTDSCYDISPCGLAVRNGAVTAVTLTPLPLADSTDPGHSHQNFEDMCDRDPDTFQCRNDGAYLTTMPNGLSYSYAENPAVTNSDGTPGHLLDPYLTLAKQYGWANFMYQTNQGGSYPAHQFLFSGTSAMTAADDANSTFVAETFNNQTLSDHAGCVAPEGETNDLISPVLSPAAKSCTLFANGSVQECPISNTALVYPTNPVGTFCYQHRSLADLLDPRSISWRYYSTSAGFIWTAPDSIASICQPAFVNPSGDPQSDLECTGTEWNEHVDVNNLGTDILRDISNCSLPQVSWVTPDGRWSDHPGDNGYGPSWVAAVVNAIGNNPTCAKNTPDAGQNYWADTAIVIMWDDWGGWSDNQPPPNISPLPCVSADCQGDYQYGFRVPMIVVSAYTPSGYIDNTPHDFGSVLRTIEGIYDIQEGSLGFADQRATTDLRYFFTLTSPRAFQTIPAEVGASYFLMKAGEPAAPDVD